ncbi:M16 family metallopeptidase [Ottowia thiooxydans]|uniref:M16 family metallopeptidase n=1 Tax=Ottowia thiooxydans TaxID=219182 RepID=UPI000421C8FE|nr:pitrilysin family protein [Ottowia thiooxydans]
MNILKKTSASRVLAIASAFGFLAPAFAAIPIQNWALPNGAQVFLVESPSIPMVDVRIDFDAGSRRDTPTQAGLADVTALIAGKGVRASGGEPALDENQLGEAWADLGASFGGGTSSDRMSFRLRTLTEPDLLKKAVHLAARELGEPAWPEDIWARERERITASLKEALTRPGTIAGQAYSKAVYGTHPYGYQATPETLAAISLENMRERYAAGILPCRAKVTVVGAVTRPQAELLVTQLLERLPATPGAACPALPAVPEVAPLAAPIEQRIAFQSAQAQVLIGQPGYKRDDPDFFPLLVGNYILGGGGFVSRLTTEVREKRGLSYSVGSYFSPALHAGAFTLTLQTRPDQANEAVRVSKQVLADFIAKGPTEAELKGAKNFLQGGFALRIDSNAKLLDTVSDIAWNGLPLNYLDTWVDRVGQVSVADIKAAFARKLQPEKMVTVVVGGAGS